MAKRIKLPNEEKKDELDYQIERLEQLLALLKNINEEGKGIKFVSVDDIIEMTGFSKKTAQELFRDPEFPSCNYGKKQIAEINAVIEYFSVPRRREDSIYWRNVS